MESALRRVLHDLDRDAAPRFLKSNPQALEEAIELAISGEPSTAWRAAWHLQAVIEENDPRLQPHVLRIIQALPDKNDGHQRELLKILLQMDLDEEQESLLFDQCLSIWESIKKQPSGASPSKRSYGLPGNTRTSPARSPSSRAITTSRPFHPPSGSPS